MNLTQVLPHGGRSRREAKRFIKFAIVGALGAITDFALLNVLVIFGGLPPIVANAFSFSAAVAQNFILNRTWTFPESQSRAMRNQLGQFALVSLVGLGINTIVFIMVDLFLRPILMDLVADGDLGFTLSYNLAKLIAIGVVLFWNFGVNRLWTYRGL